MSPGSAPTTPFAPAHVPRVSPSSSPTPLPPALKVEGAVENGDDDTRTRRIFPGETINILCMLGVWEMAVETVWAREAGDSYVIQTEHFVSEFSKHQVFEELRHHTTQTMFEMAPDPDAPTKYGIPLWPVSHEESASRDREYRSAKKAEKEVSYRQLTANIKSKLRERESGRAATQRHPARAGVAPGGGGGGSVDLNSRKIVGKMKIQGSSQTTAARIKADALKREARAKLREVHQAKTVASVLKAKTSAGGLKNGGSAKGPSSAPPAASSSVSPASRASSSTGISAESGAAQATTSLKPAFDL